MLGNRVPVSHLSLSVIHKAGKDRCSLAYVVYGIQSSRCALSKPIGSGPIQNLAKGGGGATSLTTFTPMVTAFIWEGETRFNSSLCLIGRWETHVQILPPR